MKTPIVRPPLPRALPPGRARDRAARPRRPADPRCPPACICSWSTRWPPRASNACGPTRPSAGTPPSGASTSWSPPAPPRARASASTCRCSTACSATPTPGPSTSTPPRLSPRTSCAASASWPAGKVEIATYDGDTPTAARQVARREGPRAAHQPGHDPRQPATPPRALGRLLLQPQLRGHRRGPHLPGGVRQQRGQRAPPPAAGGLVLRRRAAVHPGLGHHPQRARARRTPHRAGGRPTSAATAPLSARARSSSGSRPWSRTSSTCGAAPPPRRPICWPNSCATVSAPSASPSPGGPPSSSTS